MNNYLKEKKAQQQHEYYRKSCWLWRGCRRFRKRNLKIEYAGMPVKWSCSAEQGFFCCGE